MPLQTRLRISCPSSLDGKVSQPCRLRFCPSSHGLDKVLVGFTVTSSPSHSIPLLSFFPPGSPVSRPKTRLKLRFGDLLKFVYSLSLIETKIIIKQTSDLKVPPPQSISIRLSVKRDTNTYKFKTYPLYMCTLCTTFEIFYVSLQFNKGENRVGIGNGTILR